MNNPRAALWTTGLCVPLISIGIPKKVPSSRLVELPHQPFGDGRLYGHQNRAGDHPDNALRLWQRFFNDLYAESAAPPMFTIFQLHPYLSSRLGRTARSKK